MVEPEASLPEVDVQPGESHLVRNPTILRTILGSCVGVTFFARRLGIAALCHPMLPRAPDNSLMIGEEGRRYVDFAIRDLARQFDFCRVRRADVEVKLFGGGDVLSVMNESSRPTVGRMNCEAALYVLNEEGFHISASSLGGTCGLHIQFNTGTGEVLLRRLS